jgi:hypothetical protein
MWITFRQKTNKKESRVVKKNLFRAFEKIKRKQEADVREDEAWQENCIAGLEVRLSVVCLLSSAFIPKILHHISLHCFLVIKPAVFLSTAP